MSTARLERVKTYCQTFDGCRRFIWLMLLLGHVPALMRRCAQWPTANDGSDRLGLLLLVVCSVFFLLKLLDAPWLRFRLDRTSRVALILVAVLMHANLIHFSSDSDRQDTVEVTWLHVVMAGSLTLAGTCYRQRNRHPTGRPATTRRMFEQSQWQALAYAPLLGSAQCFIPNARGNRAPPMS